MPQPQRRTQTIRRGMMKPRNETSPAIEDQHLLNWRLSPQVERFVNKSLNRGSCRRYLRFEILILPPHPRLSVNTAGTDRKTIHRAFRARIIAIHFERIIKMENQREVLR